METARIKKRHCPAGTVPSPNSLSCILPEIFLLIRGVWEVKLGLMNADRLGV
jgi:hypothetical protein